MVTEFTGATCNAMAQEIVEAVQAIAKKHGVSIRKGRGKYTPETWTCKLEVSVLNTSGEAMTKERTELEQYGAGIGLKDAYGKVFTVQGKRFKVIGLSMSRPKYPVIGEEVGTGKRYKFQIGSVTRNLV